MVHHNLRRTSADSKAGKTGFPPALLRHSDRKGTFVDGLVDSSAQIIEAIWPLSSVPCRGSKGVLALRTFIQETLRRSRTSCSTLQVALYYLILVKSHVPKYDFTMQQPSDAHAIRALQCGRRMFLTALILASKYLQDRNYSARAWSKISGLNVLEINQNEMAFLIAVNWELHISDVIFRRWTEIVLKCTSTPPPSPGANSLQLSEISFDWKALILQLSPELDNIDGLLPLPVLQTKIQPMVHSSRYNSCLIAGCSNLAHDANEWTPPLRYCTPNIARPSLIAQCSTSKPEPSESAFGLPLTPILASRRNFVHAIAQDSDASSAKTNKLWQCPLTSSPQSHISQRRSSLANSVSSMSSPESMISDHSSSSPSSDHSSKSSRSSSFSSASSSVCPLLSSKLDVQARCRYASQFIEKHNRTSISTVPELYCQDDFTSSLDTYSKSDAKDYLDLILLPRLSRRVKGNRFPKDEEAARALQQLHNNPRSVLSPSRAGAKRSQTNLTMDSSLQESVRENLIWEYRSLPFRKRPSSYLETTSPAGAENNNSNSHSSTMRSMPLDSADRKRLCCATEATRAYFNTNIHPTFGGFGSPRMWEGILN